MPRPATKTSKPAAKKPGARKDIRDALNDASRTVQASRRTTRVFTPQRASVVAEAKAAVAAKHQDDAKKYTVIDVMHWCLTTGLLVAFVAIMVLR